VRALVFLAVQPPGKLTGAQEIASTQRIPKAFLWKVLYRLQQKKLVRSFKGVGGGYELAYPAQKVSLYYLVNAFATKPLFRGCLFGFPQPSDSARCRFHPMCSRINDHLLQALKRSTLADLLTQPRGRKPR
jgi:Rrf2 family transcriptional regulator, iron-sulfur cluster assembly transcription factor